MHWLAVGLAILAGCLGEKTKRCANGATCAYDEACTEVPLTTEEPVLCGPERLVETCASQPDFTPCDFAGSGDGACRSGICFECTSELAGCSLPGWTPVNIGVQPPLHGAWVPAIARAIVVGRDGALLRYNGFRWESSAISVPGLPADADVLSIWGRDETAVYAVADRHVLAFDGAAWSLAAMATDTLAAVTGSGDAVFAVGVNGAVTRRDPATGEWSAQSNVQGVTAALKGVFAIDAGHAIAVGGQGIVLRYRDGAWQAPERGPVAEPTLNAVWARSPTEAYAVGNRISTMPNILHYDGTSWTRVVPPGITAADLTSVWGTADGHVFAAGKGVILHFDGTRWIQMLFGTLLFDHVSGSDLTNVFAVGTDGNSGVIVRYTGPIMGGRRR